MGAAQGSVPAAGRRTRMGNRRRELVGRSAGLLFALNGVLSLAANLLLPAAGGGPDCAGPLASLVVGLACLAAPWRRMSELWLHMVPPLAVTGVVVTVESLPPEGHVHLWELLITAVFTGCAFRARAAVAAHTGVIAAGVLLTVVVGSHRPEDLARAVVAVPALAAAAGVVAWLREGLEARERRHVLEARTDSLTGLANRRALMDALARAVAPGASPSTFVVFDLDGFKAYNDRFGHPAGDTVLERMGARLTEAVGARGSAFRLGGDELCALIELPEPAARGAIRDCLAALRESGFGYEISASHGVAELPREAGTPTAALSTADARMYAVKQQRRPKRISPAFVADVLREPNEPTPAPRRDPGRATGRPPSQA